MKKGFATSAILYTMLLLFLVLMTGILNNLQNKKTILDALKKDTVSALEQDTVIDAILDQIGIINTNFVDLEKRVTNLENNTYNKEQMDNMIHSTPVYEVIIRSQSELDETLNTYSRYPNKACTKEIINVYVAGLLPLEGGAWIVETCRTNDYATQVATKYAYNIYQPLTRLERSYRVGEWLPWTRNNISNLVSVSSIAEFQAYCLNGVSDGMSLWTVYLNGNMRGAVVLKAGDYITFMLMTYHHGERPVQYKYSGGTWSTLEL